jgi:hypothetical protein
MHRELFALILNHFLHQPWPKGGSKRRFQYSLTSGHSLQILAQTLPEAPWHHGEQPVTVSIFFGIFKFIFGTCYRIIGSCGSYECWGPGIGVMVCWRRIAKSWQPRVLVEHLELVAAFLGFPVPLFCVNARNDVLETFH